MGHYLDSGADEVKRCIWRRARSSVIKESECARVQRGFMMGVLLSYQLFHVKLSQAGEV